MRVLERVQDTAQSAATGSAGSLHKIALDILAAAFAVADCPFAADKRLVDFYVHYHFLNFVKLYNSGRGGLHLLLARGHLQVLCSLSGSHLEHVVRRFYQLRVCDFLVRELSLEFECHHSSGQSATGSARSSGRLLFAAGSCPAHALSSAMAVSWKAQAVAECVQSASGG